MSPIKYGIVFFIVAFCIAFLGLSILSKDKPGEVLYTATKDNTAKPEAMPPTVAEDLKSLVGSQDVTNGSSPAKSNTRSFTVPAEQQPPPTEAHEKIKTLFEKLPSASVAFNNLNEVTVGKSFTMQFVVTFGGGEDKAGGLISSPGKVETSTIKISDRLKVLLSCDKDQFSVNEMTEPVQLIYPGSVASWSWSVTPLKPGDSSLVLNVYALLDIGNSEKPLPIQTYKKELKVKSTVLNSINSLPGIDKFVASALIAATSAFFGMLWAKYKARARAKRIMTAKSGG